jgi:glutamate carboxypeptidase
MDLQYKMVRDALKGQETRMIDQLHEFCAINSGSSNLQGLQLMQQCLTKAFKLLANSSETQSFPAISTITMKGLPLAEPCGNAIFLRQRPHLKRRILLVGHMDTVYSKEHPFQTLNYISKNCLKGPGVADMKGGLVVMLQALSVFEDTEISESLGWDVFVNADEELGSPASASFLETIAKNYQAALVYEPALTPAGLFAKERKGSGKITLIATGKAAHAGRAFTEGRNAICYLARIITAIDSLNGLRKNVTINVGKIAGGDALNVVPDKAVAKLDIRIGHPKDEQWVLKQLEAILQSEKDKDYSITMHGDFSRPVKQINPATQNLFDRLKRVGHTLNLPIQWEDSGGCCDGNNLANKGIAVIDTLGVRGGNIHSSDEFILLDSLVERATLSAFLLMDLAGQGLEELS